MLIYNVTSKISWKIHEAWLQWMLDEHIPEIMATGCFTQHQMVRLLETDEEEGPTYAVQYYAATEEDYKKYIDIFSAELRKKVMDLWGNNFIAFRTLMAIIE